MCEDFSFVDNPEFKSFISQYSTTDASTLRLKRFDNLKFDKNLAITQIECRRKAKKKLPELAEKIAYPTDVSIEQCSSEILAKFHANLFAGCDAVIDLTCGLGIDSFYIAQQTKSVVSIDAAEIVTSAVKHNMHKLGINNVSVVNDFAESYLDKVKNPFSAAFIDPSRRLTDDRNSRTYAIKDTVPDLNLIIPQIESRCNFIIVKASPMADISQTISDFPGITEVWILSVKNECKELLFKIDFPQTAKQPQIHCIDFVANKAIEFTFKFEDKSISIADGTPHPGQQLFVPNASIMKAGAYDIVADKFGLIRLAANSHLYLSDITTNHEYPGRVFSITNVLSLSKPDIKKIKSSVKSANISCRNFPMKPDDLRKRLKIADGGNDYIFATTLADNSKVLILCHHVTV